MPVSAASIAQRRPGVPASLLLHSALLAGAALLMRPVLLPEIAVEPILVDLVPAQQPTPADVVTAMPDAAPDDEVPDVPMLPDDPEPALIHATRMLARAAFADPRNEEARKMLGMLDPGTLREQLCSVEAMEQVKALHPDWAPEAVVVAAFDAPSLADGALTADGAAVTADGLWYHLRFVCTLGSDGMDVTGFDFLVGDAVPVEEQERYGLVLGGVE